MANSAAEKTPITGHVMDKMEHRSAISVSYAVYHLSTSGIAVSTATAVTHPLDVLKVRLQMQLIGQKGPLTGMGKLFAQTMKTEGPRALYLGLGPSLTRSVIYGGLRLGLYEPCKYVCDLTFGSTNILVKIASGAFSGAIATALTNPMEVLKVRLQMNSNLGRGSAIREMRGIASEEGIKGLWKGVGPAMARAAALTASQLATYDESKQKNGVVERKNCHLLEVAKALLLDMKVPKSFWGDAVLTACYLINRMLSSVLGGSD
ncbi:uncharacterized protein LOC131230739 isoform X4 [Magnolia sinica]|uniref:uncharacterized protein LOC131230739 isoform X4 n=1 Tax=Magnolia sinica TaxID=86752 RepID=UPI00265A367F|nr:uncharacterized protein LOC131230739 isoform X4 [Magnolia sinica]XP_058082679.1 uncharacterized protein LOC131230739 isoform X4 [Magnolia sinica]